MNKNFTIVHGTDLLVGNLNFFVSQLRPNLIILNILLPERLDPLAREGKGTDSGAVLGGFTCAFPKTSNSVDFSRNVGRR